MNQTNIQKKQADTKWFQEKIGQLQKRQSSGIKFTLQTISQQCYENLNHYCEQHYFTETLKNRMLTIQFTIKK